MKKIFSLMLCFAMLIGLVGCGNEEAPAPSTAPKRDYSMFAGIVADTHCIRICGRLGFYSEENKDPLKTERIMSLLIPTEEQSDYCHRIVWFGREYCRAQSPKCGECPLSELCPRQKKC